MYASTVYSISASNIKQYDHYQQRCYKTSLLSSQQLAAFTYPEPEKFSPRHIPFTIFIYYHLCIGLLSSRFPSGFPPNPVCVLFPVCAICPAHLIHLDLITQIILVKECKF